MTTAKQARKFCSRACGNTARRGMKYKTGNLSIGRAAAKHRLFVIERDGEQCQKCGIGPEWNGEPLVLQLDHIDGDRRNNDGENLRLLCPNCHSQTPTYGKQKHILAREIAADQSQTEEGSAPLSRTPTHPRGERAPQPPQGG